MKTLLLFTVASSFLNAISCAVGKTPLLLEKNILCQSKELNYWNAIILHDFKAIASQDAAAPSGIEGPLIIGSDLAIDNYYINSKGSVQCQSQYNETIPLAEYGLYMNSKAKRYQIKDAIISGSIQLHGENAAKGNTRASFHDGMVRPMQSCRLLVNSSPHQETTPSIATYENIAKKTSLYLALQKATHTLSKDGQIKSLLLQPHDDDTTVNDKYYYFNFASCQNNTPCDISTETAAASLSDPSVFSQATDADVAIAWPTDKPIVLNIPVIRNATFKLDIPQALTSQLPACSTVWNFFTVDEQGMVVDQRAEQSFTVDRVSDAMIGGTFLLPFGDVVDGSSGGFAGQLIASNYESKGASLYDFEAIDASCHIASASCWPHLTRNDAMSAAQAHFEPEQEDALEWMVRRGRPLLPVAVEEKESQSASMVDEISKALASTTTTVTEIVFPSNAAVSGSSASSMLSEDASLLDVISPLQFFDDECVLVNSTNEADMAVPDPQTTVTYYLGTRTITHHTTEQTDITRTFSRVKEVISTATITGSTATQTYVVHIPHRVEAHSTGVSFDLIGDRVVTLY